MSDAVDNQSPVEARTPPGSRLQREREKRGWSVVDAAERMHLDPWAIEALEANRFESVGPSVFAKGQLRQYAFILGLPSAEILADYEKLRQVSVPAAVAPPPTPKQAMPAMPEVTPAASTRLVAPIGGLVAVALLAAVLLIWKPWRAAPTVDARPVPGTGASGASVSADAPEASAQGAAESTAVRRSPQ